MDHHINRRRFMEWVGASAAGCALAGCEKIGLGGKKPKFSISLGEYSLHRALGSGQLDHLDFSRVTKEVYGIEAVEYWSNPFNGKVTSAEYVADLNKRAKDVGVKNLLILVDGEGALGDPDSQRRAQAVNNHKKWLEAAKALKCHSIRVNAQSQGSYDEQMKLAADGLRQLSELGADYGLNVIVENHGGYSSNGKWLSAVMEQVGLDNCGTLPDFGNFHDYDRYLGVTETMPYAKAVSAKSHEFDDEGNEVHTDYVKIMDIVLKAGYRGYVGVEYEGSKHSEKEGILLTKALLERVRDSYA